MAQSLKEVSTDLIASMPTSFRCAWWRWIAIMRVGEGVWITATDNFLVE